MMTNAMRVLLAGVAFSALAAQMGFAQPVAGLGGLKLPGAMVLIEAEAPADETPADEGTVDDGMVDDGSGDVGVSDPGTDEPPVDDGDTLVDPIDGWIDEPAPVDDDGMVWAGGDPNFCEACGGEVIEDPVVDEPVVDEPVFEGPVIEDPLPGDEGTDPVTGGEDPVMIEDDGMLYPGGDREFCENCRGETLPEVMYSTTGGGIAAPTAGGAPLAARPDHDGAQSPMCRHRPKAPGCDN